MGMDIHMVEQPDPDAHPGVDGYYRFRTPAMRAMTAAMDRAGVFAAGVVDAEKFRWNDGQLVGPAECRHIAEKLALFSVRITEDDVAHVEEVWSAAEAELMSRFGGEMVFLKPASSTVKLTCDDLVSFIEE